MVNKVSCTEKTTKYHFDWDTPGKIKANNNFFLLYLLWPKHCVFASSSSKCSSSHLPGGAEGTADVLDSREARGGEAGPQIPHSCSLLITYPPRNTRRVYKEGEWFSVCQDWYSFSLSLSHRGLLATRPICQAPTPPQPLPSRGQKPQRYPPSPQPLLTGHRAGPTAHWAPPAHYTDSTTNPE